MRWLPVPSVILIAICVGACSGKSASDDDDDGGSGGDDTGGGKGGTSSTTGGTGNGGTGGGNVGGTGGGNVGGTGGGNVGGTGGGGVGPSGLPRDAYLDELSADELHALCVWGIPLQGGPGERHCDNNITVTTSTVEECSVDTVTIHCTVGLLESCMLSLNGDPCALLTSAPCAAYIDCATGG